MQKSIQSDEYSAVCRKLVEMRVAVGWTQRQLAEKLRREHSFVWRIENGERRLDVVEFFWVCKALGHDAKAVYVELADAFESCEYPALMEAAEEPVVYKTKKSSKQKTS